MAATRRKLLFEPESASDGKALFLLAVKTTANKQAHVRMTRTAPGLPGTCPTEIHSSTATCSAYQLIGFTNSLSGLATLEQPAHMH